MKIIKKDRKINQWWAIKSDDVTYPIRPFEMRSTKRDAIKDFIHDFRYTSWVKAKKDGWSAVRVEINEIENFG